MGNHLLLRMSPTKALQAMCGPLLKDPTHKDYLGFGDVVDLGDGLITVVASIDKSLAPLDQWHYEEGIDLTVQRLDLNTLFNLIQPVFTLRPPFMVSDVFHQISEAYDIVFDSRDFMETIITTAMGNSVLIRAGDDSLRWYGHHMLNIEDLSNGV